MTKLMNMVAIAALTTVSALPAIAQQADPFVAQQELTFASSLTSAQIAAILAAVALGFAVVLDDDGNVIATTTN